MKINACVVFICVHYLNHQSENRRELNQNQNKTMKITLTTNEIADILLKDENANWSHNGALALAEWLDDLYAETGTETELDHVALRCEFDEYTSALDAASNYISIDEIVHRLDGVDNLEESALEYLREETLVVEFDGGVIVQAF